MNDVGPRHAPLWLQLVAMFLAALLPIVWLIGRRTAQSAAPRPLLLEPSGDPIVLREAPRGIAGGIPPEKLPPLGRGEEAYRLNLSLRAPGDGAAPHYRLDLQGPDGRSLWQGMYEDVERRTTVVQLILPTRGLRSGRYAVVVKDAAGIVRTFPFLVP